MHENRFSEHTESVKSFITMLSHGGRKKKNKQDFLFTNKNKMEEFNTGALIKSRDEMDPRDFRTDQILDRKAGGKKDLPRKVDLIQEMNETLNQWNIPCCTASALCHAIMIENIFDHWTKEVRADHKYQRTNNQGKKRSPDEGGDYLENALKGARKNGVKGTIQGEDFSFKIDGYSFSMVPDDFQQLLENITESLANKSPIYWNLNGNSTTSLEMSRWEIKTVYKRADASRWHAVVLWKIDRDRKIVGFANSRSHNTMNKYGDKSLSFFEISFDVFEQLINNGVFGWRYWEILDFEDIKPESLFLDFAITDKNSEEYQAVKRCKDNWIFHGAKVEWSPLNKFEPNRPITRLEVALVLYRLKGYRDKTQ